MLPEKVLPGPGEVKAIYFAMGNQVNEKAFKKVPTPARYYELITDCISGSYASTNDAGNDLIITFKIESIKEKPPVYIKFYDNENQLFKINDKNYKGTRTYLIYQYLEQMQYDMMYDNYRDR
ncbi:MAG: hypothetical protein ABIH42_04105 [Planctomycetota bacterium]